MYRLRLQFGLWLVLFGTSQMLHALPPVPTPRNNPSTEAKRVLGKILFWDEQLSVDDSIACGTCHIPAAGGADPRYGLHPGSAPGTADDAFGSPGVRARDTHGTLQDDLPFGSAPQVTHRRAPSVQGALWSAEVFWDGRAGAEFVDPVSGMRILDAGGALENQVLMTMANPVEMSFPGHDWLAVAAKLVQQTPLALATDVPPDIQHALAAAIDYPHLFQRAFGDPFITAPRIAMAIATYERSLIADQTPWDRFQAGDEHALSESARFGWESFQRLKCASCHIPPTFGGTGYFNIGVAPVTADAGRFAQTGDESDLGDLKVPSLRNVGLRTRLMHNGEFSSLTEVLNFYNQQSAPPHRDEIPGGGVYSMAIDQFARDDLRVFLGESLTDPRMANETYPFDRPRLRNDPVHPLATETRSATP